ncbi:MAG: peptidase M28, partial [Proteobacteria bacterium]|nr:peptidase M28 [Pseudomonadota bacterium]
MKRSSICAVFLILVIAQSPRMHAQTFPTDDPIIKNIWAESVDSSQLEVLAHELLDVIGPRLVGSPQMLKANDWAVKKLGSWNIEARNEQYGTWKGWDRGITHIDLLEPRVRTLEGTMLAWSPGTKTGGITARTIILADVQDSLAFLKWLPSVKGKFVLLSQPQPTGRPDKNWEEFALKPSFDSLKALRDRIKENWDGRIKNTGFKSDTLPDIFAKAGAAGIITSRWSMGWGVDKVFGTQSRSIPVVDISLEDYNLVFRLTEYGDNPLVRIEAQAKFLGRMPANNTIGMIRGTEKPEEYI